MSQKVIFIVFVLLFVFCSFALDPFFVDPVVDLDTVDIDYQDFANINENQETYKVALDVRIEKESLDAITNIAIWDQVHNAQAQSKQDFYLSDHYGVIYDTGGSIGGVSEENAEDYNFEFILDVYRPLSFDGLYISFQDQDQDQEDTYYPFELIPSSYFGNLQNSCYTINEDRTEFTGCDLQ